MPVKAPSWRQPGAFVPELQFTLRRLRLRLQGCGKAVRFWSTQEFPGKDASRPFFLSLANTFLHLNFVLWVPLASQLRREFFQKLPRLFCVGRGGNEATWGSQRKNMIREATVLQPLEEKSCSSSGK